MVSFRTWQREMGIAVIVLSLVVVVSPSWIEGIGALAVLATFAHMQVASRLEEAIGTPIACWRWLTRYLIGKEVLWFVYFLLKGNYSALVGVVLFLGYPFWRRWRLPVNHPLRNPSDSSE